MKYNFYGNEKVKDIRPLNSAYKGINNPHDLYDALSGIWCADTCAPRMRHNWTKGNRTMGQCSITAFLTQDIFGGEVFALVTENGGLHCFNVIDGVTFDLTSEQFEEKAASLDYSSGTLQDRESEYHFFKEEKRERYIFLKGELEKKCNGN